LDVSSPPLLFEDGTPNVENDQFDTPTLERLAPSQRWTHPPRFLLLYGSLRERSYSKLLTFTLSTTMP